MDSRFEVSFPSGSIADCFSLEISVHKLPIKLIAIFRVHSSAVISIEILLFNFIALRP